MGTPWCAPPNSYIFRSSAAPEPLDPVSARPDGLGRGICGVRTDMEGYVWWAAARTTMRMQARGFAAPVHPAQPSASRNAGTDSFHVHFHYFAPQSLLFPPSPSRIASALH